MSESAINPSNSVASVESVVIPLVEPPKFNSIVNVPNSPPKKQLRLTLDKSLIDSSTRDDYRILKKEYTILEQNYKLLMAKYEALLDEKIKNTAPPQPSLTRNYWSFGASQPVFGTPLEPKRPVFEDNRPVFGIPFEANRPVFGPPFEINRPLFGKPFFGDGFK
jgi:hypothetical protein